MTVYFRDKEELKKELFQKNNSKVIIKFKENKKVILHSWFIQLLKQAINKDKTVIKEILKNEQNFMDFLQVISSYQNK